MPTPARDPGSVTPPAGPTVAWVLAIATIGLVLPLAIAAHYHALGVPRSDDWSYLVTEFRWVATGRLSFNHWVSMSLVGQLLLGLPVASLFRRATSARSRC